MTHDPPRPDEGYLVLATGPARYLDMAANLAASIKVMDPGRLVCVVHDAPIPDPLRRLFDHTARLPPDPDFGGLMDKLRLFDVSPYVRTMAVDADCLLVKRDIQSYWDIAAGSPFAITGGRRVDGAWYGVDIATLLRQEGAPYLIQMNSGVFCFDRRAAPFFAGLVDFYRARHGALATGLFHGRRLTDEVFFGLHMGRCGMDTGTGGRMGANSWMVSTWRGFGMRFDPARGVSVIRKPRRLIAGLPHPLGGWDTLSPSFAHFVGCKPARPYRRLARAFRVQAGV